MARALNYRNLSVFPMLLVLLLGATTSVLGQTNLITNGDFEAGNTGFESDYVYYNPPGTPLSDPGVYVVKRNPHDYHPTQFFDMGDHTSGSGKFFIANGKGLLSPDRVWSKTVTVTPNTNYSFTFWATHISVGNGETSRAKFRVKINGTQIGSDFLPQYANGGYWDQFPTQIWNSGNNTTATITIYDRCAVNSGMGDDFGIDDISFIPETVYSVTANNDTWPLACFGTPVEIPVLDNDIISPSTQNATVQILTQPSHGEATVLSNKKIEYIFNDASFSGTDQLKYRVGFAAQNIYADAWVYITVGREPVVANITAPGPICTGGVLGIPTPSVNPSASGQWEYSSSQNGSFQTFDPNNIPLSMNGKWVRYSASNDCGDGHSNAVQITVTNGPSFSGQTPQIQPICANQSLNLPPPSYNANGSQIISYGWVAAPTENGDYTSFSLNNISGTYNGWYIRYMVEGSCGYVYSNPARQLTVNVAPSNIGTLVAPDAICASDDLEVTPPTYDGTGTGVWEICQTQNGTYQSFNINNVPAIYNNWYLHYKVSNDCGSVTSNAVQIHVNEAPTVATPATPSAICAGGSFNLVTPTIQSNGFDITDQGWQIAANQNGSYSLFNNNNVQYSSNGYWIRYFAVNECGETHSASVQITVNAEPIVGNITAPAGICAGGSFNLTAPSVQWRHTNQGTGSWEIAPTSSGDFTALNNNNIPYSYNGYYLRYKAVNGCGIAYSTNVVQVTVFSTDPIDEGEITACDAMYHHGVYCDQNGAYVTDSITPNGCTIQVSWHFTLSEAYAETQSFTACESFTWPKNGQTYYTTCTDTYTYISNNPLICDSIFTLDLIINNEPEILENLVAPGSACAGNPLNVTVPEYSMNHVHGGDAHWEYASSANGPFTAFDPTANTLGYGTYYLRYAVSNECGDVNSNVVSFHINDTPVANMQLSAMQVCEGETLSLPNVNVNWRNDNENERIAQWQMSPTQNGTFAPIDPTMPMQLNHSGYWLRFMAQNGCGIDVVGPVMITVISVEDQWLETITACDAYVMESGQVITESTTIDYEEFEPCYHLVHQQIIINHSDYVVEPITSCHDEFEWHGITFYRSEQTQYASVSLTNIYDCDSVVELQLDFGEYAKVTEQQAACDFYEWPRKPGSHYTESQLDSLFIQGNDVICDSMIYLNLTIGQTYEIQGDPMTECSGFVWHGVPYYANAVVYDSLQTVGTHCDSIIAYQLTIIPPIEEDTSMVSCQPMWWNGYYFEVDGDVYTHTFISQYGCDSIVTMHFSLSEEIQEHVDYYACEPFVWHEHFCSQDGQQYAHTFTTSQGCDSTVFLTFHMLNEPQIVSEPDVFACDSYMFGGVLYTLGEYEVYHDTVYSVMGHCDSIVHRTRLEIGSSEQIGQIAGSSNVYVASNLISGIYRYEIDPTGIIGDIVWSISNSDWSIVESHANYCSVLVSTPGSANLIATFQTLSCGEMEKRFEINAGFFDVAEHGIEVNVYPNPTKGSVTVEADGIEQVRVLNMMGQVLEVLENHRQDQIVVNLTQYGPSVYLVEIKTVNGMVKKRVVVCK